MDAGNWYEARGLLEQVHKAQTGFLETERLLRKIENEITKIEELQKRNIQINTLYEQAHGLLRSKNWREALGKIEEIQQLDPRFEDKDEIAKSAGAALNLEEQEIQKQNQLAAMYAEAVRLLKEGNYQETLDKWQEVRAVDSKYPDRQWVQRTAKRKLAESGKPLQIKPRFVITKPFWIGIVSFVVLTVAAIAGVILSNTGSQKILSTPTRNVPVNSPATNVPHKTNTPRPSTPVPTVSGYAGSTFYEGFDDPVWDGKINPSLWIKRNNCGSVAQQNGSMVFKNSNNGCDLIVAQPRMVRGEELGTLEAKLMIADDHKGGVVTQEIDFFTYDLPGGLWWSFCGIFADQNAITVFFNVENPGAKKSSELNKSIPAKYNQWYVFRMEVDPQTMTFSCQVDGKTIGSVIPKDAETLRNAQFERLTEGARYSGASVTSHADYIQILP
jgi:tetratricopeptide (TPR) repeat protein